MRKYLKSTAPIHAIFFFLLLGFSCEKGNLNLIGNPGFEKGEGEEPEGWVIAISNDVKSYILHVDDTEFYSGKKSYKISRIWTYPRKSTSMKTEIPIRIDPQKDYILSFWYKTRDIHEYPLSFRVEFLVESENTPRVRYEKKIYNSDSWQQYFILLDHIPSDAMNLELSFNTNVNTKGSIWIDDIVFQEATERDIAKFEKWRSQPLPKIA